MATTPRLPADLVLASLPQNDFTDDVMCMSLHYPDLDLSSRRAEGVEVSRCRFEGTSLVGSRLEKATFTDTVLQRCDLANMSTGNSSMVSSSVSSSRLTGLTWNGGLLRDVLIESCRADLASFRFSRLKKVVFRDCNLQGADFQNADLRGVRFDQCNLSGAQFSNVQAEGARFANCSLLGIRGVTSLQGAIVRSEDALGLAHSLAAALGIKIED
jgi:uncharacterized protein YjbI with pentapeptide repeats